MIPDTEIKSKLIKSFGVIIHLKIILLKSIKSIHTFMSNMKNIYKLMIINVNIYYLKLICTLVNIL